MVSVALGVICPRWSIFTVEDKEGHSEMFAPRKNSLHFYFNLSGD